MYKVKIFKKIIIINILVILSACGGQDNYTNTTQSQMRNCEVYKIDKNTIPIFSLDFFGDIDRNFFTINLEETQQYKLARDIPYFTPYDIKSGMSYVYGFNVADYKCNGTYQVSFFNSYTKYRNDLSSGISVSGFVAYFKENIGVVVENVIGDDNFLDIWPNLKTDILLIERGVSVDLNGDGFIDMVQVGNFPGGVFSYINPGLNDKKWIKQVINLDVVKGPVNIAAFDLNKDGVPDFVVSGRINASGNPSGSSMLAVFLSDKDSAKWKASPLKQADMLRDIRELLLDDFDNDGEVDLIFSDITTGGLYVINNLLNPKSEMKILSNDIAMYQAHYGKVVALADSKKAILLPSYMSVNLLVHDGVKWNINKIISLQPNSKSLTVTDVKAYDIDGDEEVEIFFSVSSSSPFADAQQEGGIYIFKHGKGVFKIVKESSYIAMFDFIDFNNDGKIDVVYNTEYPRNSISVLLNQSFRKQ
jgi:hypothetical protein